MEQISKNNNTCFAWEPMRTDGKLRVCVGINENAMKTQVLRGNQWNTHETKQWCSVGTDGKLKETLGFTMEPMENIRNKQVCVDI